MTKATNVNFRIKLSRPASPFHREPNYCYAMVKAQIREGIVNFCALCIGVNPQVRKEDNLTECCMVNEVGPIESLVNARELDWVLNHEDDAATLPLALNIIRERRETRKRHVTRRADVWIDVFEIAELTGYNAHWVRKQLRWFHRWNPRKIRGKWHARRSTVLASLPIVQKLPYEATSNVVLAKYLDILRDLDKQKTSSV